MGATGWVPLLAALFSATLCIGAEQPHIIFILADDLGFNDVGFHGSRQIPTPNIDALAYSGIIMNNYYVQPLCTPSRSAIMTGLHPIHTGMQHNVILPLQPYGLPLNVKTLPESLKELGYTTKAIGKWHLGMHYKNYTPTLRGFDSFYGYWNGAMDYYDHTVQAPGGQWGYDFRRDLEPEYDAYGSYATDLFTNEAVKVIAAHLPHKPLFMYLSHLAMHSANAYDPLQAPQEDIDLFPYIEDLNRRKVAAIMHRLDQGVGHVIEVLDKKGMLDNSLIVFTTDNGGAADGFNMNWASNWPLRGMKGAMWEGGVRGAAAVWSPLIKRPHTGLNEGMMAVEDWMPTLLQAAGGGESAAPSRNMDGISYWSCLSKGEKCNERLQLLHNIDETFDGWAVRQGDWKLMLNPAQVAMMPQDGWFGPSGINETDPRTDLEYIFDLIVQSKAGTAVLKRNPSALDDMNTTRASAMIKCPEHPAKQTFNCRSPGLGHCLFNITADPCEMNNVAHENPKIVAELGELVTAYRETLVPHINAPNDKNANPIYWNMTWTNWLDYPSPT